MKNVAFNTIAKQLSEAGARNSKKDLQKLTNIRDLLNQLLEEEKSAESLMEAGYINDTGTLVNGVSVSEIPAEKIRKIEGGIPYPSSAYLFVGNPSKPNTWSMRVRDKNGNVDFLELMNSTTSFLRGWWNNYDDIVTEDIIVAVRDALVKLWEEIIPGFSKSLLESASEELADPGTTDLKESDNVAEVDEDIDSSVLLESKTDAAKNEAVISIIKEGIGNKKDKHYYSEKSLKEAADNGIFNGVKMYVDHLTPTQEKQLGGQPRSLKDWVATIKESWWDEATKEVKGKIKVVKPYFMDFLREAKEDIGVSIRGRGRVTPNKTVAGSVVNFVESLMVPKSVDFVTEAGAGGRVIEILEAQITIKEELQMFENLSKDEVMAALKESKADIIADISEAALQPMRATLQKMARTTLDASISAGVLSSDLPQASKERLIKDLKESVSCDEFIAAEDQIAFVTSKVSAKVADEKSYLGALSESKIITGMGGGTDQSATKDICAVSMATAFGHTAE